MKQQITICDGCKAEHPGGTAPGAFAKLELLSDGVAVSEMDLCESCAKRVEERGLLKVLMKKVPHPDLCVCKNFVDPAATDGRRREAARAGFTDEAPPEAPVHKAGSHHPFCQHHDAWESQKPITETPIAAE